MRQIRLLAPQYQITVAGFGDTPDAKLDFVQLHLPQPSLGRKFIWAAQLLTGQLEQPCAHKYTPKKLKIVRAGACFLDATAIIYATLLPQAASTTTVCRGITDEYAKQSSYSAATL
jgi:hypothetical protein